MHFVANTLDDLIHESLDAIQDQGHNIEPSKGPAREITGVLLELRDPLARISSTETKGTPFSCLGELCWYLSGRNDLASIEYYLRRYADSADDGVVHGGYGPRIMNQLASVLDCLERKDSRQAVVQLFAATDIQTPRKKDVPCTCTLQFLNRRGELSMLASLRSNDVFWGLPHDVFCFTMLQELVAKQLDLDLGSYKHVVGSLHLYAEQQDNAEQYLREGWQPTDIRMPPMPDGDPWPSVQVLLTAEEAIRNDQSLPVGIESLDPYWRDLVRLFEIYKRHKCQDRLGMSELVDRMHSSVYGPLIARKLQTDGARDENPGRESHV